MFWSGLPLIKVEDILHMKLELAQLHSLLKLQDLLLTDLYANLIRINDVLGIPEDEYTVSRETKEEPSWQSAVATQALLDAAKGE